MYQRVGSCSICGGDVMGYRGIWHSVVPPPPDRCSCCGAVAASDVIQMARPTGWGYWPWPIQIYPGWQRVGQTTTITYPTNLSSGNYTNTHSMVSTN